MEIDRVCGGAAGRPIERCMEKECATDQRDS